MNGLRIRFRVRRGPTILLLLSMVPLTMGGCQDFRNDVVDAFETATRGLLDAALNAAFDSVRSE
jgi:hypothetical protein